MMKMVDAFIIANDVTNRCNPLYEAIRASLPVISVHDPSTRDLLKHDDNALLSVKDDNEKMGQNMAMLCRTPELRQRLSRAQEEYSRSLWTWAERMAVEVKELEALKRPK